jgi:hypothetical protein
MQHSYQLYQFGISSEMALPELAPATGMASEVRIAYGEVLGSIAPDARQLGPFLWATAQSFWLKVPEVAAFLIRDGKEIIVQPEPGIDDASVRVFLLGSAMGVLMFQRQHLVLHGNAVQLGDGCLVCVGPSGAGKSTLAAALMRRGYPLLADDVVPVNAQCEALPGFPRIKLWQDSAEKMQIATDGLARIRPDMEKFNLPTISDMAAAPLPIRWVYILSNHNKDEFVFEAVRGMDRFPVLRNNTYRVRFLEGMDLKAQHLSLCAQLSAKIRLVRVTRPNTRFALDELADRILADAAESA